MARSEAYDIGDLSVLYMENNLSVRPASGNQHIVRYVKRVIFHVNIFAPSIHSFLHEIISFIPAISDQWTKKNECKRPIPCRNQVSGTLCLLNFISVKSHCIYPAALYSQDRASHPHGVHTPTQIYYESRLRKTTAGPEPAAPKSLPGYPKHTNHKGLCYQGLPHEAQPSGDMCLPRATFIPQRDLKGISRPQIPGSRNSGAAPSSLPLHTYLTPVRPHALATYPTIARPAAPSPHTTG